MPNPIVILIDRILNANTCNISNALMFPIFETLIFAILLLQLTQNITGTLEKKHGGSIKRNFGHMTDCKRNSCCCFHLL